MNGDVVYHLHGRHLGAEIWNDPTYFTAMVQGSWPHIGAIDVASLGEFLVR